MTLKSLFRVAFGVAASAIFAAGCSYHTPGAALPNQAAGSSSIVRFGGTAGTLYVAAFSGHVYAYAPGTTSPKLTITAGIHRPVALGFDASNNLYVVNAGPSKHGSVTVYASGQGSPIRTIEKGLSGPGGGSMAVTSNGTLVVGDVGGISEYQPGATAPFLKIPRRTTYVSLATQTSFYATTSQAVGNFTIGSSKPNFAVRHPFMVPGPTAVDSTSTLYVVDACGPGCAVYEYDSTGDFLRTLSNVDIPVGVFVDSSDNAWVNNYGEITSSVEAFHPGQSSPFIFITKGISAAFAITVDAAGTLYVADGAGSHDIVEYASGSTSPTLKFPLPHGETASALIIAPPGL